ncbi:MAG: hypothetical protein ABIX12_15030 [Rubrivivax sp.]
MTILPFHLDDSMLSFNQTFYPEGCVFAMLPSADAAERAARELGALAGIVEVQLASPQTLAAAFQARADQIRDRPPSAGREEQFEVRFLELAARGEHGLLLRVDHAAADTARAKAVLDEHRCSVAYHYGRLVIEEWVAPDRRAEAAAAGTL